MSWFRKIFCRHRVALAFVRNIHGDEINHYGGKRSEWFCPDCETFVWEDQLHTPDPTGTLDDMRMRKDAAYFERNQVVAALASAYPSGTARTAIEGWSEDWHGCVYIDLPTGQASWHYHDSEAHLFAHLPPYAGKWDGHTTKEKYDRLAALAHSAQTTNVHDAERFFALREAHENSASEAYFEARRALDESTHRKIFEAGFKRGFACCYEMNSQGGARD